MIFVTVGTQKFPMNRLLMKLDELIASGEIKEEIIAQIGMSDYKPKYYKATAFLDPEQYAIVSGKADLIITHGGVASIINGLRMNKPVVVFPRLAKYGEHVDDHQLQIADSFEEMNLVLKCIDTELLGGCIEEARTHRFGKYVSNHENAIDMIRDVIRKYESK